MNIVYSTLFIINILYDYMIDCCDELIFNKKSSKNATKMIN